MLDSYAYGIKEYTWYASSVISVDKVPYDTYSSSNRYQGKTLLSNEKGRRIQFIQRRWFPKVTDYDTLIYVDMRYQYRPDIISVDYFNTPLYAWAIMAANGIRSIWQLEAGQFIKIPALAQVMGGLNS